MCVNVSGLCPSTWLQKHGSCLSYIQFTKIWSLWFCSSVVFKCIILQVSPAQCWKQFDLWKLDWWYRIVFPLFMTAAWACLFSLYVCNLNGWYMYTADWLYHRSWMPLANLGWSLKDQFMISLSLGYLVTQKQYGRIVIWKLVYTYNNC